MNGRRGSTLEGLSIAFVAVNITFRHPLAAVPRLEIFLAVHDVHLLESKRLGIVQEEVNHDTSGQICAEEDKAETIADTRVRKGSKKADEKVPPVMLSCVALDVEFV